MKGANPSALALITWLATVPTASAEPIRIVDGSLVWTDPIADITLTGDTEGFTYTGSGDTRLGRFGPWDLCSLPECREGRTVQLSTSLDGSLLGGNATYRGEAYRVGGGFNPVFGTIWLEWSGSVVIPAGFTGGVLTTPFLFRGSFGYPDDPNNTLSPVPLTGSGTATLTFRPWPSEAYPGAFDVSHVRYDFSAADPVPEAASMLLIGTGLAGLAAARRRRRQPQTI